MKPISTLLLVGSVILVLLQPARASARDDTGSAIDSLRCSQASALWAGESPTPERHYGADREVQTLHLALTVTPDFVKRAIQAKATLRFRIVGRPAREIALNAVALRVKSLEATDKVEAWQNTDEQIIVTYAEPLPVGKETTVSIDYSAEPADGLYFRTQEMGYKPGDAHLFSQGEAIGARNWYPCLDEPNQRFTSEITCLVPEGMTVISNGRLVSEEKDSATGLMAFHWSQDKPHANYLISLLAGYFKKVEDRYGEVPIAFYTPASEIGQAETSFRDTKDMLGFFEKEIGVRYPWDKYFQVCVNDFVAGGMENTSVTTLTDRTLFTADTENIRESDGLVAHELAHQWFGDLVTCRDWSHLWLNEGFATYYETLYDEHRYGHDNMLYELRQRAVRITSIPNDTTPIVRRDFAKPDDMFGYLVYPKASWVLHMLRSQLGADLYRRCIKTYLERHQLANVTTEDLRAVIEELSGRPFDRFFDQWLYHGHHPELEVTYAWDQTTGQARLSVRQVQQTGPNVLTFDFPLTVRFHGEFGTRDCPVEISRAQEDFYFALPSSPDLVRLDPDYTLLAKIDFKISADMLRRQIADNSDMIGRLLAIEQLAERHDREAVDMLKDRLNHDPFYGVRLEAAKALQSVHSDEALAALLASQGQDDARVRLQVVESIGGFYGPDAFSAAARSADHERNPAIRAAALRQLGAAPGAGPRETLLRFLHEPSYRNELEVAAIAGLRAGEDPASVPPILEVLKSGEKDFDSPGYGQGLEALGYLSRDQEKKKDIREFLLARLQDLRRPVRAAAINALGALADPAAIPALQRFATAAKSDRLRQAAERALASLRAARKAPDEFTAIRQEVLDLEKANRDLRKELDGLKKQVEAAKSGDSDRRARPRLRSPKD